MAQVVTADQVFYFPNKSAPFFAANLYLCLSFGIRHDSRAVKTVLLQMTHKESRVPIVHIIVQYLIAIDIKDIYLYNNSQRNVIKDILII